MSKNSSSSSGGIGFFGLLTIVLIVLKLTSVITWSWVFVLSPLIVGFIFWVFIILFIFCATLVAMGRR